MRRIFGVFYVQNRKIYILKKMKNINVLKEKKNGISSEREIKSDDTFSFNPLKYEASRILWTVRIVVFQC